MISDIDFIEKTVGCPWVNRADTSGAYDCWGLVLASFREIDDVELPSINGYNDKSCSTESAGEEAKTLSGFTKSQASNGAIMVVMNNKGMITHVGRCLAGRVLHSTERMGVRWETYSSVNSQFKNIEYFKYAAN